MEPVIEEEASRRSLQEQASSRTASVPAGKLPPFSVNRNKATGKDHPSIKYKEIEAVNRVVLQRALSPPKPVLPRRSGQKTWNATAKERHPLASSLSGPGRAGKHTKLIGDAGGIYEGEVLAGRPHGNGRYLASKGPGSDEHVLQYEGEWVQGRREGLGTRYYLNGEQYMGQFVSNIRHGTGRYFFTNGDMYVGSWLDDKRTGKGTYFYASGDIFVGNFLHDKKEGMGILYMMERQKKYVAEYVNGSPKCGTVLALEDGELEPLQGQLAALALHKKLDLAASGRAVPQLPELQLKQPNKVLAAEVVTVRRARSEARNASMRAVQDHSGSLGDRDLEMLRHSYTLMAAGDDLRTGLLPHQLRELCVMAGLDPAADLTRNLVEELLANRDDKTGRIGFDAFLKVVLHFRNTENEDLPEPQAPSVPPTDMEEDSYLPAGPQTAPHSKEASAIPISNTQPLDQDASVAMYSEASMQQLAGQQFLTGAAHPAAPPPSAPPREPAAADSSEAPPVLELELKVQDETPAPAATPVDAPVVTEEATATATATATLVAQQPASGDVQEAVVSTPAADVAQASEQPASPEAPVEQPVASAVQSPAGSRPGSGQQPAASSRPASAVADPQPAAPEEASAAPAAEPQAVPDSPDAAEAAPAAAEPVDATQPEGEAPVAGDNAVPANEAASEASPEAAPAAVDDQAAPPSQQEAASEPEAAADAGGGDGGEGATAPEPEQDVAAAQADAEPAAEHATPDTPPPVEDTPEEGAVAGVLEESGLADAPAEQQADELVGTPAVPDESLDNEAATEEQLQPVADTAPGQVDEPAGEPQQDAAADA